MDVRRSTNASLNSLAFRLTVSLSDQSLANIFKCKKYGNSSTMPRSHQVYECVHCSRPAFTGFIGEIKAEERLWVFKSCFRVVVSSKYSFFEGHPLFWVNCRCGQELGCFIPRYTTRDDPIWFNNYITIVGNVKASGGRILQWFQSLKWRPVVVGHCRLVEDVLFEEILPRLPVESLRRFKGVCKKWRHCITTDSHFMSNHLRRSSDSTKMSIIIVTSYSRHRMFFVDHRSNTIEVADVSMVLKKSAFVFCKLVGSCDGLVCLRLRRVVSRLEQRDEILLWNPETGQSRDVNVPPPYCNGATHQEYPVYGFGFDQSHNDYKVVKLVKEGLGIKLSVFSMNTGCWKELENRMQGCKLDYESDRCILVCSRLYWVVICANVSPQRHCILWFDLNDDEFGIMDVLNLPCWFGSKFIIKWNSNSLAFIELITHDARKEFRFHFILQPTIAPDISLPPLLHFKLLGVSWGQFFVNVSNGDILMYDFETGVGRGRLLLSSKTTCIIDDVCEYVPSLISVYSDIATRH